MWIGFHYERLKKHTAKWTSCLGIHVPHYWKAATKMAPSRQLFTAVHGTVEGVEKQSGEQKQKPCCNLLKALGVILPADILLKASM